MKRKCTKLCIISFMKRSCDIYDFTKCLIRTILFAPIKKSKQSHYFNNVVATPQIMENSSEIQLNVKYSSENLISETRESQTSL